MKASHPQQAVPQARPTLLESGLAVDFSSDLWNQQKTCTSGPEGSKRIIK